MFIIRYSTLSVDISKLIKYYTDHHEVDEDSRTISAQGGSSTRRSEAGITFRDLFSVSTATWVDVAFEKKNK